MDARVKLEIHERIQQETRKLGFYQKDMQAKELKALV